MCIGLYAQQGKTLPKLNIARSRVSDSGHALTFDGFKPMKAYLFDDDQFHKDPFKNACLELLTKQNNLQEGTYRIHNIQEVFQGYFPGAKLYVLTYELFFILDGVALSSDHDPFYSHIYMLDTATKKEVVLASLDDFNKALTQNAKPNNLDQCYLYMFLVEKTISLTRPTEYRKAIAANSIWIRDNLPCYSYMQWGTVQHRPYRIMTTQMQDEIGTSTRNSIKMFDATEDATFLYQFVFGPHRKLQKVVKNQTE